MGYIHSVNRHYHCDSIDSRITIIEIESMDLSKSQKRALFKIAMDLVKIDDQIHGNEVLALEQLQQQLAIEPEDIDLAHYVTLSQAIASLQLMNETDCDEVLHVLDKIIKIDNNVDRRENMLLSAIKMALINSSRHFVTIVSALDSIAEMVDNQIIYLEKNNNEDVKSFLNNKYEFDLLSNVLSELGIHLFYLPEIIKQLRIQKNDGLTQLNILQKSIEYLIPSGCVTDIDQIKKSIENLDPVTFTQYVCTHYHVKFPSTACLMIAIQDTNVLDDDAQSHRCTDYLCLDITQDIKQRILTFIQVLNHSRFSVSYQGYYKTLMNFLSVERKINSSILISAKGEWTLADCNNKLLKFNSAPQSKTLYLLLIRYGSLGITLKTWAEIENIIAELALHPWTYYDEIRQWLLTHPSLSTNIVLNLLTIYRYFSNRDTKCSRLIEYLRSIVTHRSSLKNYINTAIADMNDLANKEQYFVCYNADNHSYFTMVESRMLFIETPNGTIPLEDSALWKNLI